LISREEMSCKLCSSEKIVELGKVGSKPASVTSDSKLCAVQARAYICRRCRHIQKFNHDDGESATINSVYENYAPHYLSGGNEQLLFPEDQQPRPRTFHVIEKCIKFLPKTGKLLDIGTGNGAVLKSASRLLSEWQLHAFDIVDSHREEVLKIPHVESFFCGKIDDIDQAKYDLIVLWHALEHISSPMEILMKLKDKITDDGYLLVQVPDVQRNPFDLAVIDHYSHFTFKRLAEFVRSLGFVIVADGYEWTHNCLTVLLKKDHPTSEVATAYSCDTEDIKSESCFYWVNETLEYFKCAINNLDYAIFGTGMASIWLLSQLPRPPLFFIDEDNLKSSNKIDNIQIIGPKDLHRGELNIIMPFIKPVAANISGRIKRLYKNCGSYNFVMAEN